MLHHLSDRGISVSVVQVGIDEHLKNSFNPLFRDTISTAYVNPETDLDLELSSLYAPLNPTPLARSSIIANFRGNQ